MRLKHLIRILSDSFNIKKQADELGLKIWQAPSFLFILMGLIIVITILSVYFSARNSQDPEFLILSEVLVVIIIFTIGNFIIRSVEEVAKLNKMKSEFISIASHQLKTPISQINWEVELLLSKYSKGLKENQLEIVETIEKSNQRMSRLANDLLDVARIDQGRLLLEKEKVDLVKLVESIIEGNQAYAKSNGVGLKLTKSVSLPPINIDKRRIKVVVDNLISNAIKYIRENGYVEISIERGYKNVEICVKDNGVGIPENQQGKIFEKFFRSSNVAKYQTEGTGLGLYIAKNIVDQSGGKMWFKSIEGVGTAFYFTLPLEF